MANAKKKTTAKNASETKGKKKKEESVFDNFSSHLNGDMAIGVGIGLAIGVGGTYYYCSKKNK